MTNPTNPAPPGGAPARIPRVAVVGCGLWGRNHVRNHAEIGSLAAVVDHGAERAAEIAARHGVPARTFEEVLDDPAIEALVFALPPSRNLPLGRRALGAGKHLFVEKPLALTVADGAELCRVAEETGRVLMVGHILHYHPAFAALVALVAAGRLGPLLSLGATRFDLGRIRREEDALWALGTHDVSMVLRLVGAAPTRVRASGGFHTDAAIADLTSVELGFPGGVRAEIRSSWLHPVKEQRLVVVGRDAMAVFDDREPWERKLVLHGYRVGGDPSAPTVTRDEPEAVPVEPGEPLRRESLHFLHCVRTGATPLTDGREGLRVLDVLTRAQAELRASL